MPIPPKVPTSFVPHPQSHVQKRFTQFNFTNVFAFASMIVFIVALLVSGGVFLYGQYLSSQLTHQQSVLSSIQKKLGQTTISEFLRTSAQLSAASTLLNQHVTTSRLFDFLEAKTVKDVQLISLEVGKQKNKTTLKITGVARDFNALVAESRIFLQSTDLSGVAFSNISPDAEQGRGIDFSVTAIINPTIISNFTAIVNASVNASNASSTIDMSNTLPTTP